MFCYLRAFNLIDAKDKLFHREHRGYVRHQHNSQKRLSMGRQHNQSFSRTPALCRMPFLRVQNYPDNDPELSRCNHTGHDGVD